MHVEHAAKRLDVVAAGVEDDAFADEAEQAGGILWSVPELRDAGIAAVVALTYGKKCAGAEFPQALLVEKFEFELCFAAISSMTLR